MPVRTRADMHIGLDLILETLNSSPSNRMDPAIKDYLLNATISKFVKNVVDKANAPDELKRVPFRILTYGDILNKYNDIYTLIKVDDTLLPTLPITDNNYYIYTLPSDLFRFEASFTHVRPVDCITYPSATASTLALSGTVGNVDNGVHKYIVVFVYPTLNTDIVAESVASITVADKTVSGQVNLTGIPLGLTGCTARKIYRTTAGGTWYNAKLLTTISNNTATTFTDNIADSSLTTAITLNSSDTELPNLLLSPYDIIAFNNNPYGGKRKYIGTIIDSDGLKLYHLQRYAISKFGIIYIANPAILTSSPTTVDCDLPGSVHDKIVEDTATFIAAAVANGSYEQLLNEAKDKN